jgi:translation initiation factor IF-1
MTFSRLLLLVAICWATTLFLWLNQVQGFVVSPHHPQQQQRTSSSSLYQKFATSTNAATSRSEKSVLFGKKVAREQGNDRKNKTERVRKPKDDVIEVEATVLESLPNAMFRCAIIDAPPTQDPILSTISGKIRKNFVKILVGDKVLIELSPYDLTRGRITFRYR